MGIYYNEKQIGFARIVTDYAVFAWIADVIIDEKHRGKGLGKKIIEFIQGIPDIPKTTQMIRTKDAHLLYEKYGFKKCECISK
ncbi:MAG TPA: GNAT family N-acetyltransferase [Ruminiclostridium sp.]|nr:GNAT family N-acetyltransferase [Ruminiclostridium sp.]